MIPVYIWLIVYVVCVALPVLIFYPWSSSFPGDLQLTALFTLPPLLVGVAWVAHLILTSYIAYQRGLTNPLFFCHFIIILTVAGLFVVPNYLYTTHSNLKWTTSLNEQMSRTVYGIHDIAVSFRSLFSSHANTTMQNTSDTQQALTDAQKNRQIELLAQVSRGDLETSEETGLIDLVIMNSSMIDAVSLYQTAAIAADIDRPRDALFLFYAAQIRKHFDSQRFDLDAGGSDSMAPLLASLNFTVGSVVNPLLVEQPQAFDEAIRMIEGWNVVPDTTNSLHSSSSYGEPVVPESEWEAIAAESKQSFLEDFAYPAQARLQDEEQGEVLHPDKTTQLDSTENSTKENFEQYQKEADVVRVHALAHWAELIEEYHQKTGRYPLSSIADQINGELYVFIARDEQLITVDRMQANFPPNDVMIRMDEFVNELEAGLGREIDELYDPQLVTSDSSGVLGMFVYIADSENYYLYTNIDTRYSFTWATPDKVSHRIEITNNAAQPWQMSYEAIQQDAAFQKLLNQEIISKSFLEQIESNKHKTKEPNYAQGILYGINFTEITDGKVVPVAGEAEVQESDVQTKSTPQSHTNPRTRLDEYIATNYPGVQLSLSPIREMETAHIYQANLTDAEQTFFIYFVVPTDSTQPILPTSDISDL